MKNKPDNYVYTVRNKEFINEFPNTIKSWNTIKKNRQFNNTYSKLIKDSFNDVKPPTLRSS